MSGLIGPWVDMVLSEFLEALGVYCVGPEPGRPGEGAIHLVLGSRDEGPLIRERGVLGPTSLSFRPTKSPEGLARIGLWRGVGLVTQELVDQGPAGGSDAREDLLERAMLVQTLHEELHVGVQGVTFLVLEGEERRVHSAEDAAFWRGVAPKGVTARLLISAR